MSQAIEFNLASPTFKMDPYPAFAQLRSYDPIHLLSSADGQSTWLLTRYADVEMVLRDERFMKDQDKLLAREGIAHQPPSCADLFGLGMSKFDPPDHTRLRLLVNPSFTPRQVELWRERIQQIADELIDGVEERGSMDLIEEFAFPLPLTVILQMLGVHTEDSQQLHEWTRIIVDALDDPVAFQQAEEQLQTYHSYLVALVESKQRVPADDLVSRWLQENEEGDRLSDRELVVMIFLLIMAGYQTTGTLISNGILALLTHPQQMALLKENPDLIKLAVEELLRYRSPLMLSTFSWAREDVELGGKLIRRGDLVLVSLAAANCDEEAFTQPGTLDITRQENPHLAFSKGAHYCLGAPLARLEGQIAISTLLRRLPNLRLQADPTTLEWRSGAMVLGMNHLPVSF
ncbi:MAG TPA: cytochrome P450 [Ktedonobacteraceae bacterium]|nr:cytochrome P450 [Ktedonobacteraceae bacterium]